MDSSPISVRKGNKDDMTFLSDLIQDWTKTELLNGSKNISTTDLERDGFQMDPPYFWTLVAENENKLGMLMYYYHYSTWEGKIIFMRFIHCQNSEHYEEVLHSLISQLAKIAFEEGCKRICFDCKQRHERLIQTLLTDKFGAIDVTKADGWFNFYFDREAVESIVASNSNNLDKNTDVNIRDAKAEDCRAISDEIMELAVFENYPDGPQLSVADLERDGFQLKNPIYKAFVLDYIGQVVGYALYFYTYSVVYGKTIHLEDFYVTPQHRGKGFGKMLFASVAKVTHDKDFSGFTLQCLDWNERALKFYEARGGVNLTKTEKEISLRFLKDKIKRLTEK